MPRSIMQSRLLKTVRRIIERTADHDGKGKHSHLPLKLLN